MPPFRRTGWKRRGLIAAASIAVVVIGIQFIRPGRPRGELPGDGRMNDLVVVPAPVDSLLRRSCYDCHSDETRWPSYAQVAPASWLLAQDVRHGRSNLDFSRWSLDPIREPTPQQRFQWMCRDVRRGIMPPRLYLIAHPGARLTEDETNLLCAWAQQRALSPLGPNSEGGATRRR
ncbi:MAG: heme-binding domain-containing protein [Gemmatimonadaceae bacterium]|nr:heme-binding domain-containing protein [Gemmatimonadaceae bacterium]